MKPKSIIRGPICVALIFVVLTSGCVSIGPAKKSYSGDKLQKSEVAVIKGRYYYTPLYYDCVVTFKIDNEYLGSIKEGSWGSTKVELLPGWHELVIVHSIISYVPYNYHECVRAAFNFEAGHEYKIKVPFRSHLVQIVDVNTGVTVFSQALVECDPWWWSKS